jgi:hypothetical protein
MSDELFPFGKYKGQPTEVVLADQQYVTWLLDQPWFRESRFQNIYNTIINYSAGEPETPDHNAMQIKFLDAEYRRQLFVVFNHKYLSSPFIQPECNYLRYTVSKSGGHPHYKFEDVEEDIYYRGKSVSKIIAENSLDVSNSRHAYDIKNICSSGSREIISYCSGNLLTEVGFNIISCLKFEERMIWDSFSFESDGWDVVIDSTAAEVFSCSEKYYYNNCKHSKFLIELKPSIGDDYPSILRKLKSRRGDGTRLVITENYIGQGATLGQVSTLFSNEGYTFFTTEQLKKWVEDSTVEPPCIIDRDNDLISVHEIK